jgi:putative drug exporter of the RND superfamily
MMFHFLGRVVRRAWPLLLAGWALVLLGTWYFAPPWSKVAQDQELAGLPADVPSREAEKLYAEAFPQDKSASNVVVVLHRPGDVGRIGNPPDAPDSLKDDLQFIEDVLEPGLRQIAEAEGGLAYEIKPTDEPLFSDESKPPAPPPQRSIIARIRTPNAPGAGALLVSPDRKALLVVVDLTPEFMSRRNWEVIDKIIDLTNQLRDQGKVPAGLEMAVTGSAVIGRDHSLAELRSIRSTGLLTVLLVAGLLIFIYRAPLLAVIPLATVYLAVQISLNVLGLLAEAGYIQIFQGLQIYITILAYGAGVDYCLFLTARYKEELDRGAEPVDAVAGAVGAVGAALAASAATVMFGIAMMTFASFGQFHEAGFAVPLSLLMVLAATLTFSPALLCLAGRWAFWPMKAREAAGDGRAAMVGRFANPPYGVRVALAWVFATGWLERIWERLGEVLLRRAGTVWLVAVAVMAPFAVAGGLLYNHLSYDVIGNLPADASSVAGTRLLQQHFPAGVVGPIDVLLVAPNVDFRGDQGRALAERLTDRLRDQRQELGLADVRSLTAPLGITKAAENDFSGLDLPKEERAEGIKRAALDHYTAGLGKRTRDATRLELVLDQPPFSEQGIDALGRIEQAVREALPDDVRPDAQLYVAGTTASIRDYAAVMQKDRRRIELLVLAAVFVILAVLLLLPRFVAAVKEWAAGEDVFVILVVLLRRFLVPVYLLLSVLFSYYTTLGVAFAVFWLLDPAGFAGIDWKVAIFLFTILIAVGEDYNIFLMTRVDEEQRRHGPLRGITEALDRTGPIISSCGIIMAGTFASLLLSGALTEMKQLGFALAFGVLLDTFIVRPILVPAFLILLRTDRLSPAGGAKKDARAEAETAPSRTPSA